MKIVDEWRAGSMAANLRAFAGAAGRDPADVISIKLRPVLQADAPEDRYVYSAEYQELAREFSLAQVSRSYIGGGAYAFPQGPDLVEHETGPEILLFIEAAAKVVDPYVTLAGAAALVAGATRALAKTVFRNCQTKSPDRYYHDARCLRVERRRIDPDGTVWEEVVEVVPLDAVPPESQLAESLRRSLQSNAASR